MTPEVTKTIRSRPGKGAPESSGLRHGQRRGQRHRAAEAGHRADHAGAGTDAAQPLLGAPVEQRGSGTAW